MSARDLPPELLAQIWQHLPVPLRLNIRGAVAKGLQAMKTPEPLDADQWAERHFYLSAESSQGEKRWESYPFQRAMLGAMGDDDIEEVDVKKSARVGYALALDTPIPTVSGWSTMGTLKVGDKVFDERGLPCVVMYTSPIYRDHDCFEIVFCDGTRVVADKGHRWLVESDQSFEFLRGERGTGRTGRPKKGAISRRAGIVNTGDLFTMQRSARARTTLAIRNTQALWAPDVALPIPPYTLGLWLGDGNLTSPRITQHRSDVETADFIRTEGIAVDVRYIDKRNPNNATLFFDIPTTGRPVSPWATVFRSLGLMQAKSIPAQYLRASSTQRLELLRGLMDSDGTIGKSGRCEFSNTNKAIADGVFELVTSLGIKAFMQTKEPRRAPHLLQYRVGFKPTPDCNPFHLSRKAALVQPAAKPAITHRRRIVSITPVSSVPVRCIEVSSLSSLFLCTRSMVPTHNTKMLLAVLGYFAQHKRRNQCLWQPTDGDSDEFCKAELEPMLRDVKAMQAVFPQFMAKSKANTLNMKKFLGSLLYLKGGTSAGNFRRMTLQVGMLDEFDAFDQKIEKSADPFTLAHKRLEGATYPKIICGTTPRIRGLSHIEKREVAAEARMRYNITCPHCSVEHPLTWGKKNEDEQLASGIQWDAEDPEGTARHACPHCRGTITQADYLRLWHTGCWVSECGNYRAHHSPYRWTDGQGNALLRPPRHVAFHVWTAYSPQTTWAAIVRQFLQCVVAKRGGDKAPLEGFINETLGETWEEQVEKEDAHALMKRGEDYPLRRVPVGGLQLVAGVDVQDKRWEVTVWAIGRGEEMWAIDYQVIDGNLADEGEWEKRLHPYLQTTFTHMHGAPMKIAASAIDTGGHYTHQSYNFCRQHVGHKYFAIKGDSADGKPIKSRSSSQDVNWRGRIIRAGVKLWMVGTDTAKDLFFGRLKVTQPGPGYVHFSKYLPVEWFNGLTSEVRKSIKTSKGETHRWVKTAARNEALDTTVYALFCSQALDHYKMTEAQWTRLENDLLPDLFDQPTPQPQIVELDNSAIPATLQPEQSTLALGAIEVREPDQTNASTDAAPYPHRASTMQTQQKKRPAATTATTAARKPAATPPQSPFASSEWLSRL